MYVSPQQSKYKQYIDKIVYKLTFKGLYIDHFSHLFTISLLIVTV